MKWLIAFLVVLLVCAGVLLNPAHVNAAIVQWSGNGHWYEPVLDPSGNITWTDANNAATARGGYLASITSAGENSFVFGLVGGDDAFWFGVIGPWLGGYQDHTAPDYSEPAGGWRWVSGENWSFSAWNPGEPNNGVPIGYTPGEDRLHFWGGSGGWNDAANNILLETSQDVHGYIVEYTSEPTATPEPSTIVIWSLLGGLGIVVGCWRRGRGQPRSGDSQ